MPEAPEAPEFFADVERDVVVVAGSDATSFLQSLVSQDLDPVAVGASVHSLLLQPQGKLIVDFVAVRVESDTWWCVCEGGFGAALFAGLKRFKIRVKVDLAEQPVAALAVRGRDVAAVDGLVVAEVPWNGPAFDVVGPAPAVAVLAYALQAEGVARYDADEYERARIEAGVPRLGLDTDERTIPQEAALELTAVSFTKGCFVGQELVCRIDSRRGHVNRFLRRLRADTAIAPGAGVESADGKAVGEVTSSAGEVALAMLRREIEPGATVRVAPAITATVEAL